MRLWRFLVGVSGWLPAVAGMAQLPASVPFQGCASDGQLGPVAAPRGRPPATTMPAAAAARLAWYKAANTPGVFAPRGWHCFGTYGSNGSTLYVSPDMLSSVVVFREGWPGFTGPAVQISSMSGSTSGRFEVARHVARYFPQYLQFVQGVIAEGIEPGTNFPRGAFPQDEVRNTGKDRIEYATPAHREGEGTQSRLRASDQPIAGFVFVSMRPDEDPFDVTLSVRLGPGEETLARMIRDATEVTLADVDK